MTDYGSIPLDSSREEHLMGNAKNLTQSDDWDYAIVFPNNQQDVVERISRTINRVRDLLPSVNVSSNAHLQAVQEKLSIGVATVKDNVVSGLRNAATSLQILHSTETQLSMDEICQRITLSGLEIQLKESTPDAIENSSLYVLCQIRLPTQLAGDEAQQMNSAKRILQVEHILKSNTGANLDLCNLTTSGVILAAFALHNENEKVTLSESWLQRKPLSKQPLDDIESYFGSKITLYFAFLGHYTRWLVVTAIIGSMYTLFQLFNSTSQFYLDKEVDNILVDVLFCIFAIFIVLWFTIMLERWKRLNVRLVRQWKSNGSVDEDDGLLSTNAAEVNIDPQDEETPRPQYIEHPEMDLCAQEEDKRRRRFISWLVLIMLLGVVSLFVSLTFYVRSYMAIDHKENFAFNITSTKRIYYGGIAASMLNVVQISLMSMVFEVICYKTTDYENHRTQESYEKSFILKFIVFQMVNNFAALFYIAFIKSSFGGSCDDDDCLLELQTTLIVVFGSQLIASTIQQSLQQRVSIWFNKTKAGVESNENTLAIESEFYLLDYGWREMFDDYMVIILQVGFTVFFAAVFPLASFFSLFDNIFKIRVNSYRLLAIHRRPKPQHAATMGIWIAVLDALAVLSVITNSFTIVYTSRIFDAIDSNDRILLFTSLVAALLLFRCHFWFAIAN